MEKKLYAPKATKYLLKEDGSKLKISDIQMNCKWCGNELNNKQKYEYIRRKRDVYACSRKCACLLASYGSKEAYHEKHKRTCIVCNIEFQKNTFSEGIVCSIKCQGVLSSERMKVKNPMFNPEYRKKASDRQKEINHKPKVQGGNGRGATLHQLMLYNELSKHNSSFTMEHIERTGHLAKQFNSPRHYKIDIASKYHMLAIEVDGSSHNLLKVKECDERKTKLLNLKGWKVLRLSNSQIQKELENCVQMVLSMI